MADKFVSLKNLKFLLYDVFDSQALCRHPLYEEHGRETFDLVLDTALKLGQDLLRPSLAGMDREPPRFEDGRVLVHPSVREMMREFGQGGWIAAQAPFELEGQQLPITIGAACRFIFAAANYSASVYPMLTWGAAHLIASFGTEELIRTYVPRMFSGQWTGTMALTEPQAGSSLADITSLAEPAEAGHYLIRGQKIFISNGDHDGADNVVHLLLARIKGAPAGVKGISLFVVPKLRPEGGALVSNDVAVAGIYHKLGYRGAPITQLSLGENNDCRGWLVGQANRGLGHMFQMMNESRLEIGAGAAAIASAAYYASLDYARQRPQGRRPGAKDPTQPQVNIIEHSDIKRMLLFQRAVVEGSLGLVLQCALYADLARVADGEEAQKYALLLDLLTPVAKSYPSEMGILACSQGLQILGGYGYCDEFPLEQFYRDARIHPIHEGTTGIQGLDLLGRKVVMKDGAAFKLFLAEAGRTVEAAGQWPELAPLAGELAGALGKLEEITGVLIGRAGQAEAFLADSTLYLELFGLVGVAWQWLKQAAASRAALAGDPPPGEANFHRGKIQTCRYFFGYELPKMEGLLKRLASPEALTVDMALDWFED